MSQPVWRLIWRTDNEALFEDTTGVYEPELEVMQETGGESDPVEVYRFSLDRLQRCPEFPEKLIPGRWEPSWTYPAVQYEEWFSKDLPSVAESCSWETVEDMRNALCSEKLGERAEAYLAIGGYHGLMSLDSYPLTMTYEEWETRWERYLKAEGDES